MIRYKTIPSRRLLLVDNEGVIPPEEYFRLIDCLQKDVPEVYGYDSLSDLRKIKTHLNYSESARLVGAVKKFESQQPRKTALLVEGPLQFGTSRMFEQLAEGEVAMQTGVVRSVAEAAAFLAWAETELAAAMNDPQGWTVI